MQSSHFWSLIWPLDLVPKNWTVATWSWAPFDLSRLEYVNLCLEREGQVKGVTVQRRATAVGAVGTLLFARAVLNAQDRGVQIIPQELQSEQVFLFGTIVRHPSGRHLVPYMDFVGKKWGLYYAWLDSGLFSSVFVPRVPHVDISVA